MDDLLSLIDSLLSTPSDETRIALLSLAVAASGLVLSLISIGSSIISSRKQYLNSKQTNRIAMQSIDLQHILNQIALKPSIEIHLDKIDYKFTKKTPGLLSNFYPEERNILPLKEIDSSLYLQANITGHIRSLDDQRLRVTTGTLPFKHGRKNKSFHIKDDMARINFIINGDRKTNFELDPHESTDFTINIQANVLRLLYEELSNNHKKREKELVSDLSKNAPIAAFESRTGLLAPKKVYSLARHLQFRIVGESFAIHRLITIWTVSLDIEHSIFHRSNGKEIEVGITNIEPEEIQDTAIRYNYDINPVLLQRIKPSYINLPGQF